MAIIIAILAFGYLVSSALSLLNLHHMQRVSARGLPSGAEGWFDRERLGSMVDYNRANVLLGLWGGAVSLAAAASILVSGLIPWLANVLDGTALHPGLQGLAAFFAPLVILYLAGLPASLASSFGIEKRFGFSTITAGTWIADQAKGLAVSGVLMGLLFLGFYLFIRWLGHWWWVPAWLLAVGFSTLVSFVAPVWLAPLFNKFRPLEDRELNEKVLAMAGKADFPLAGVYQMDASKRSTHDNAYFTGLGATRRIVFFDTMLRGYSHGELLAVMGHEIGHWKLGHIPMSLGLSAAMAAAALYLASLAMSWEWLYRSMGILNIYMNIGLSGPVVGLALLVASMLFSPLGLLLSPLANWISRRHEYQSDAYSLGLHPVKEDLKGALEKLSNKNLSNLFPHPLYVAFRYSHPPLLARLEAIDRLPVSKPS